MESKIDQLIELIKNEENALDQFLNCLTRQKEFIIRNKVDEFDETVREVEEIIGKIRDLELGRMELVKSIAATTGSADDDLTLTRLIELNLGESSTELKNLKITLSGLVDRIKKANRVNQYLIKRSLSFIQKNIDWFIDDNNLNFIYLADGKQKVKDPGNLLIDKVL
ncbi:flagellar protein FlgN [bacterium]|nr:flagellar protein FlgN [bacterium]